MNKFSVIFFMFFFCCCHKQINPVTVDNITLIQVDHPYIGHRVDSIKLDDKLVADFLNDFADKKEEITKFYSCYVVKIQLKNGELISYRTNGQVFEKFKDNNTKGVYFKLNKDINLVTKYWGISEEQFCNTVRNNVAKEDSSKNNPWFDFVNFDTLTVRQYVQMLKLKEKREPNHIYLLTTGAQASIDWIKETDIEYLVKLINSNEPANCVMQAISSQLPRIDNLSTLGGQVMNLIDAYRFEKKYPFFLTNCATTDKKREAEILKWWNEQKNNR